jgi:hypothetical protein
LFSRHIARFESTTAVIYKHCHIHKPFFLTSLPFNGLNSYFEVPRIAALYQTLHVAVSSQRDTTALPN